MILKPVCLAAFPVPSVQVFHCVTKSKINMDLNLSKTRLQNNEQYTVVHNVQDTLPYSLFFYRPFLFLYHTYTGRLYTASRRSVIVFANPAV